MPIDVLVRKPDTADERFQINQGEKLVRSYGTESKLGIVSHQFGDEEGDWGAEGYTVYASNPKGRYQQVSVTEKMPSGHFYMYNDRYVTADFLSDES